MMLQAKNRRGIFPPKAEVEGSNPFGSASFTAPRCTSAPRTTRERTSLPGTCAARVFPLSPVSSPPYLWGGR